MNIKMATYSQLSTIESKKQTKQTTRTGPESQIWRSLEDYQQGGGEGKKYRDQKHNWQEQNRQGEIKNSIGNGEAKEFIHMTCGHELGVGIAGGKEGTRQRGDNPGQL